MEVNTKKLCDLISLAVLAIMEKEDKTVTNTEGEFTWFSPVTMEVGRILGGDQCSCEEAKEINDHIATIRLGMKLGRL